MAIFHFLFTFTTLIFTPFLLLFIIKQSTKPKPKPKLPPGPPSFPVIGHLHHLIGDLPHHALTRLSEKHGPLLHLRLGQVSTVAISSPDAACAVLKTLDPACADRPDSIGTNIMWYGGADLAFSSYGEHWRQMRKICILELLSARNVKSFAVIRQLEVGRLLDSLRSASGEVVNLTAKVFALSGAATCRAAFGKVMRGGDTLTEMMKEAVTMAGGFELADLFPSWKLLNVLCFNKYRLMRMRRRMDAILDVIVEEHRSKRSGEFGGEDIVDVLLRMQKKEELQYPITNDNIKAIIFDMFSAGTETTSTTIDWVMAELMRNPKVMHKAQAEIRRTLNGKKNIEHSDIEELKYLKLVIKETLRLHPPIPLLPRACRKECEVDGYTIPLKSKVMINVYAMGRSSEYWEAAEEFRPERFAGSGIDFTGSNMEYIPFGAGRRACPGINFGLALVELTVAQLLYHLDWRLPEGTAVDMAEGEGIAVARKNGLFVVPTAHYPDDDDCFS